MQLQRNAKTSQKSLINRCHRGQIIIGSKEKCILHNPSIIFSLKHGTELLPSAYEDGVAQLPAGALHHGGVVILDEDGGGHKSQENSWWKDILFFEVFAAKKIIIFGNSDDVRTHFPHFSWSIVTGSVSLSVINKLDHHSNQHFHLSNLSRKLGNKCFNNQLFFSTEFPHQK